MGVGQSWCKSGVIVHREFRLLIIPGRLRPALHPCRIEFGRKGQELDLRAFQKKKELGRSWGAERRDYHLLPPSTPGCSRVDPEHYWRFRYISV